jgi:hypothetical protein
MDGLEAIGNLLMGLVQLMVFLSSLLVRGFVWIFALIANQFGHKLGQRFVNNVVLTCAIAITLYLGIGYMQIAGQSISVDAMNALYPNIIVYPLILINGILWIGYWGAPSAEEKTDNDILTGGGTDWYGLYYLAVLVPLLMIIASLYFVGAKSDFTKAQKRLLRKEECIEARTETAGKLQSLANKFGLGDKVGDNVEKKLTDSCK